MVAPGIDIVENFDFVILFSRQLSMFFIIESPSIENLFLCAFLFCFCEQLLFLSYLFCKP